MVGNRRIVVLGRSVEGNERLARVLEGAGFIVASTANDGVAIDMAGASYDALLIGDGVSEADRRYVATQARERNPGIVVLTVNSHRSVLTQLAQHLPG